MFRIARMVVKDLVISTADPQGRHAHRTAARGFDGYRGHAAVDPDSELITATVGTPGKAVDGSVAEELIEDPLVATRISGTGGRTPQVGEDASTAYGDKADGTGALHTCLEPARIASKSKTQRPTAAGEWFTEGRVTIDLQATP